MRALGLKLLDDSEQMADRPGEPIESDHDQGFAGSDFAKQTRQNRPGSIGARRVFLEHGFAARGAEFVKLGIGALLLGGHARVADADGRGGRFSGVSPASRESLLSRSRFLQFDRLSVNGRLNRWPSGRRQRGRLCRLRRRGGARIGASGGFCRPIAAVSALSAILRTTISTTRRRTKRTRRHPVGPVRFNFASRGRLNAARLWRLIRERSGDQKLIAPIYP